MVRRAARAPAPLAATAVRRLLLVVRGNPLVVVVVEMERVAVEDLVGERRDEREDDVEGGGGRGW